jgi:hypothetical protein
MLAGGLFGRFRPARKHRRLPNTLLESPQESEGRGLGEGGTEGAFQRLESEKRRAERLERRDTRAAVHA